VAGSGSDDDTPVRKPPPQRADSARLTMAPTASGVKGYLRAPLLPSKKDWFPPPTLPALFRQPPHRFAGPLHTAAADMATQKQQQQQQQQQHSSSRPPHGTRLQRQIAPPKGFFILHVLEACIGQL
jgi:hypothetical protein